MAAILTALVPVALVVALGVALRRRFLRDPAHWFGMEQLTYFVLFPALLVVSGARADLSKVNLVGVIGAFTAMLAVLGAALLLARPALQRGLGVDGPSFTSLFQGVLRWNTYVALAAVGGLYGASGITVAAVALVCLVPIVNVICVAVLSRYGGTGSTSIALMVRQLARNPLIWSCAAGMAINVLKVPVPAVILEFGDVLGRASLAIGLLVVGGGLVLRDLARPRFVTYLAAGLTLVVKPLLTLAAGVALGLSGLELTVIVLLAAVPSAPAGYVLARQMGGNAPLLAEMLTVQIVFAAVTMPVITLVAMQVAGG